MKRNAVALVAAVALAVASTARVANQSQEQREGQLTPEQLRAQTKGDFAPAMAPWPKVDPAASRSWPLNNLDTANSRYSTLDQINSTNIRSLAVKWLYHTQEQRLDADRRRRRDVRVTTPTASSRSTPRRGRPIWTNSTAGSGRGAAYGDGKIYVARDARVVALDAKTGELVDELRRQGHVERADRGAERAVPAPRQARGVGLLLQHGAAVPRRHAHRRHGAQREPHPRRLVLAHRRRRRASRCGSSGACRRDPTTRGGRSRRTRGSAACGTAAACGRRRRSTTGVEHAAPDDRQSVAGPGRLGAQGHQPVHATRSSRSI